MILGQMENSKLLQVTENNNTIISFPAGRTIAISEKYLIHAHPIKKGFPKMVKPFLTLRSKGGHISAIYRVTHTIEIMPHENNWDSSGLNTDDLSRIKGYIKDRSENYGFSEKNIPYRFYFLEIYQNINPAMIVPNSRSYVYQSFNDFMITKWIITESVTGRRGYNIFKASQELDYIWWTASNATKNIKPNDIVYMYVGAPYFKIMYSFLCTEVNDNHHFKMTDEDIKYWKNPDLQKEYKGRGFKLERLQFVDNEKLSLHQLNGLGLVKGNIRGSFKSDNNPRLFQYIDKQFAQDMENKLYAEDDVNYNTSINSNGKLLEVEDIPVRPSKAEKVYGFKRYHRDPCIGRYALNEAGYQCEVDHKHKTFFSRVSNKPYLEVHHLIPISAQGKFKNSLDVPANIVALCSNCHNEIHYGKDSEKLIRYLYESRKERLSKAGIYITIGELLELYNL